MLEALGYDSLDELIDATVPRRSGCDRPLGSAPPRTRARRARASCAAIAAQNQVFRSYLGHGLPRHDHPAGDPAEHPREPGLVHAVHAVPGGDRAGPARGAAQLPDDGHRPDRAARSPTRRCSTRPPPPPRRWRMRYAVKGSDGEATRSSSPTRCHPQTIDVVQTRAEPLGHRGRRRRPRDVRLRRPTSSARSCSIPATDGAVHDYRAFVEQAHAAGRARRRRRRPARARRCSTPPGELGRRRRRRQRAALRRAAGLRRPARGVLRDARRVQARRCPGRIIGVSQDAHGQAGAAHGAPDARAAHPPREGDEQHLHGAGAARGRSPSMYAVYHGPDGLTRDRASACTRSRARSRDGARASSGSQRRARRVLRHASASTARERDAAAIARAPPRRAASTSARSADDASASRSTRRRRCDDVARRSLDVFARRRGAERARDASPRCRPRDPDERFARTSAFLTHPVFNTHHSETEMLRYMRKLEARDLSLAHSMIPLGSCTMKLNATAEMIPVTWPEFGAHAPVRAGRAGRRATASCSRSSRRGSPRSPASPRVSLQPNAGSQGEYAGLLVIRALPRGARRGAPRRLPHPAVRARHEPGERGDGRHEGRRREDATRNGNIDLADLRGEGRASTRPTSRR